MKFNLNKPINILLTLQYKWMQDKETTFEGKGVLEDGDYKDVG